MADKYLLESGAPDGYQTEDAAGVLLLEDPPPSTSMGRALMLVAVLAAWPSGNLSLLTRSTLIQSSADQPPQQAALSVASTTALRSWEPLFAMSPRVAPIAAVSPPPPVVTFVPVTRPPGVAVASWPSGDVRTLWRSGVVQSSTDPPPRQAALSRASTTAIQAWDPPFTLPPRLASIAAVAPPPPVVTFVPYRRLPAWVYTEGQDPTQLLLVSSYVSAPDPSDQPPRQYALSLASRTALQAWDPDRPAPPPLRPTAGWNVPPVVAGYVPPSELPASIYLANQPADPLPRPALRSVVPTFPAVSQPTPQAPLSVTKLTGIVATWAQSWEAQSAAKNAGWNVPAILISLPHTPPPQAIWSAWEPPFIAPPRSVTIAPLTLTYGQAPPLQAPLSVTELTQITATWVQTWDAQTFPDNASWNVPPILVSLPYVPLPRLIWGAWEPPWIQPPTPVDGVTLTLPTGTQPPPRTGDRQVAAAASWTAETTPIAALRPTAGWNVPPPVTSTQIPSSSPSLAIWTAWETPFVQPRRLTAIAPLTLVYGQAPPVQPALRRGPALIVALAWPPDLEPRRAPPQPIAFTLPSVALPPYLAADEFLVAAFSDQFFVATWSAL